MGGGGGRDSIDKYGNQNQVSTGSSMLTFVEQPHRYVPDTWHDTNPRHMLTLGCPGAEVIKLFSCSTQLSMKFKMLINIEIAKIDGIFRFNLLKPAIYPANKC